MADPLYTGEVWLPIPGYEGWYEASSHGRIRSVRRGGTEGRVLAGRLTDDGYQRMSLSTHGVRKDEFAHKLVVLAFHGLAPEGKNQVAHWDGDKLNNRPENLRWADVRENAQDKVRHGVTANQFGERHSHNKLTTAQVLEIRSTPYWRGFDVHFAAKFGVQQQAIGKVRRGERWRHLLETPDG